MAEAQQSQLTVAQQLLHSTVRIECLDAKGAASSGTGFNFSFEIQNSFVPVIITNRHVFEQAIQFTFHYTMATSDGQSTDRHEQYSILDFSHAWIGHPDPDVDLALVVMQPFFNELEKVGKRPFYINLSQGIIAPKQMLDELDAIEDVTMIGYPNGLWDDVNNLPIVRRGITATSAAKNYRGKREFLIDAACYPGSSGSPVFIFNSGSFSGFGGAGIAVGTRLALLGVLYAGHMHTTVGEIKAVPIPTATTNVPLSRIPNNLGICIHASRILEFAPVLEKIATAGSLRAARAAGML